MRFNGKKENLHSLWDTALVELEQGTPSEIAGRIQSAMTSEIVSNGSKETAAQWVLESLAIVRTRVYRLPASGEDQYSLQRTGGFGDRDRLAQAGARLAWMLNETLT